MLILNVCTFLLSPFLSLECSSLSRMQHLNSLQGRFEPSLLSLVWFVSLLFMWPRLLKFPSVVYMYTHGGLLYTYLYTLMKVVHALPSVVVFTHFAHLLYSRVYSKDYHTPHYSRAHDCYIPQIVCIFYLIVFSISPLFSFLQHHQTYNIPSNTHASHVYSSYSSLLSSRFFPFSLLNSHPIIRHQPSSFKKYFSLFTFPRPYL